MRYILKNILQKDLLTSSQAATMLKVHPSAIRQMAASGELESVKKGFVRLFDIEDIIAMKK